jgi:Protein of unknown function (DUF3489)
MSETTTTATEATVTQPGANGAPKAATPTQKASPKKSAPKAKKTAKGKVPKKTTSAKGKTTAKPSKPAGKGDETGRDTKKAQVREMLRKGTTLSAIIEATGWQPHTTRGFISILSKKENLKIESTRRDDGERFYKTAR